MAQSDSGQERTEDATPRKREKALADGKIPRSQEFSSAIVLLAGVGTLAIGGGLALAQVLQLSLQQSAAMISAPPFSIEQAAAFLQESAQGAVIGLIPVVGGVALLSLFANLIQARGVFSMEPLRPKASHINPLNGLKRIFSLQSVATLLKSSLKLVVLVAVSYAVLNAVWYEIVTLALHDPTTVLRVMESVSIRLAVAAGIVFLALSAGDYLFQVHQHAKNLRMTRQEVVQEHKEQEGDPLIKSRIRAIALAMSRKRMLSDVATADVVITNPTHLAIALKYDMEAGTAPVVVAMGARKMAERIKELARKANVPCVENKPLAQALMATATVGEAIPPALYIAVAEVLAFVFRRKNGARAGGRAS